MTINLNSFLLTCFCIMISKESKILNTENEICFVRVIVKVENFSLVFKYET